MATEVTSKDLAGRHDPREVGQERAKGTVDLDGTGEGSVEVSLSGTLQDIGVGLFYAVDVGDGEATVSEISPGSATVSVTGGTANAEDVEWQLVVSEDAFYRDSGGTLGAGEVPE